MNLNPDFLKGISNDEIRIESSIHHSSNNLESDKLPNPIFENTEEQFENIFPVEVLPKVIQEIISDYSKNLSFPIDIMASSMLFAASTAIGNSVKVRAREGWDTNAVIYLIIVAPPGSNKSHPLRSALKPIAEIDKKTYREYLEKKSIYDKTAKLSNKERTELKLDEPTKPIWSKFLLSDFTAEALAYTHQFNKRGIAVHVDEIAGWIKNFNRYNSGSEMEFWLSVWSGEAINITRKTSEPVYITSPHIPVAGTIQNGLLYELAKGSRMQNGFLERILWVILPDLKKLYWGKGKLSEGTTEKWDSIISKLLEIKLELDEDLNPASEILHFTDEAYTILLDWQNRNADECNATENESLKGVYSKMEVYAIRLALILELLKKACNESLGNSISSESILGALQLVNYFKVSAKKVNSIISNYSPLDKLPIDKRNLYLNLPDTFSTSEGLQVANKLKFPERNLHRFLLDKTLFRKLSRGYYQKQL